MSTAASQAAIRRLLEAVFEKTRGVNLAKKTALGVASRLCKTQVRPLRYERQRFVLTCRIPLENHRRAHRREGCLGAGDARAA